MDPDSEPSDDILLPRNLKIDGIIVSEIVNLSIMSIISRWIDKVDIKFSHLRGINLPYKFELLLRGSRDGFSPQNFHNLCNNKPNTVTFIKVDGTGEILGGYNPSIWKTHSEWCQSFNFIFSFKNKYELKDPILSHIKSTDKVLNYSELDGPSFGSDLKLSVGNNNYYDYYNRRLVSNVFNCNICKQDNYEKKIRDTEDEFVVKDYEVFQIIKK